MRKRQRDNAERDWKMHGHRLWRWRKRPRAKEHERLWKLEKDSPLEPPEGIQPSRHPDLRTYDPQSSQILNLCCLKPPDPWQFFTATMGHSYRPEETQPLQVIAKGPRTPPAAPALLSTCSVRGTWPSSKDTTVTLMGHNPSHQNRTNRSTKKASGQRCGRNHSCPPRVAHVTVRRRRLAARWRMH